MKEKVTFVAKWCKMHFLFLGCIGILFFAFFFIPSFNSIYATGKIEPSLIFPRKELRIVPLYAAFSDILVDLGGAGLIVGKTAADDTKGLESAVLVGTHMRPNVELISALAPDLVILLDGREEAALTAVTLEKMGIPVARFRLNSFNEIFFCISNLGAVIQKEEQAQKNIEKMQEELLAIATFAQEKHLTPRVFFEVRYPNLLGAGEDNIVNDIIKHAGGENVLGGYPEKMVRLNEETLLAYDPDVYIYQKGSMNKSPFAPEKRANYSSLRAVKSNRCYEVEESLFSRPGKASVQAVKELASILFGDEQKSAQVNK